MVGLDSFLERSTAYLQHLGCIMQYSQGHIEVASGICQLFQRSYFPSRSLYAPAVSFPSAGRITVRSGMRRKDGIVSMGWWVGPSSPTLALLGLSAKPCKLHQNEHLLHSAITHSGRLRQSNRGLSQRWCQLVRAQQFEWRRACNR